MQNKMTVVRQVRDAMKQTDMRIAVAADNMHEIHFSIQGPSDTMFESGIYHGKIELPKDFPFKAPNIQLLSPNGRFTLNKNICINGYSAWHEDTWSCGITIAAIVRAVGSLFSDLKEHGIGYDFEPNPNNVKQCKDEGAQFKCPVCGIDHRECFKQQ